MEPKVAVITGSSSGIGRAIAKQLLDEEYIVILNGRNAEKLRQTYTQFASYQDQIEIIKADISQSDDVRMLIETTINRYGRLDVLINNAGLATQGAISATSPEVIRKVFEVNTIGAMMTTKLALPHLVQTGGSVIFVSSVAGIYGIPMNSVYASSKAALGVFAQSLEMELESKGVHIGLAILGFVENDSEKEFLTPSGEVIRKTQKRAVFQMSQAAVAKKIWEMILHRKRRIVLTPLGKFNDFCSRYARWFIRFFFRWKRSKVESESILTSSPVSGSVN